MVFSYVTLKWHSGMVLSNAFEGFLEYYSRMILSNMMEPARLFSTKLCEQYPQCGFHTGFDGAVCLPPTTNSLQSILKHSEQFVSNKTLVTTYVVPYETF